MANVKQQIMSEPSQSESKDIQERRLEKAFGVHREIQDTLDEQAKQRQTDKRFAMLGVVILIIIAAIAIYYSLSSETIIVS